MLVRPTVMRGGLGEDRFMPGDILADGRSSNTLSTNGAGTITAAMVAAGILVRDTVGAGFTDTLDTTWNIIKALAGNFPAADVVQGLSFLFAYKNTVAQALTLAAGDTGTSLVGTTTNAGSLWREYLITILNATPQVTKMCGTTNGNKVITFDDPVIVGSNKSGAASSDASGSYAAPTGGYGTITPGMVVNGTGITNGTKVVGVTYGGQGNITGVTTDTNSTATNASGIALTFLPCITVTGLGTSGL